MRIYDGRDTEFIAQCYEYFRQSCSECGAYLPSQEYASGGWSIILDDNGRPIGLLCRSCIHRRVERRRHRSGRLVFDPGAAQRNWHPF